MDFFIYCPSTYAWFYGNCNWYDWCFDAIEANNNISPALVAGGIKVALLTTVFGLIVAMILQVFYNYIISKIDNLVNSMKIYPLR